MKKILFLSLASFGAVNFANAWEAKYPQDVTVGGGKTTFSCKSYESEKCMSGSGSAPTVGQDCIIYHHGAEIPGVVVRTNSVVDDPSGNPIIDVVAETDFEIVEIPN